MWRPHPTGHVRCGVSENQSGKRWMEVALGSDDGACTDVAGEALGCPVPRMWKECR